MRFSRSLAFASLASVMLSACTWEEWKAFWEGLGSVPVVCPSHIELDPSLMPQQIKFRPYVENRGIKDNTEPFTVKMQVTSTSGGPPAVIKTLTFTGNGLTIKGTQGVSGLKAGPEVALTSTTGGGSWWVVYDANATYGVTLDFKSNNSALDAASDKCRHLGPVNFKGGEPL